LPGGGHAGHVGDAGHAENVGHARMPGMPEMPGMPRGSVRPLCKCAQNCAGARNVHKCACQNATPYFAAGKLDRTGIPLLLCRVLARESAAMTIERANVRLIDSPLRAARVREGTPPLTIAPYVGAGSGLCRACFWLLGALICNCARLRAWLHS
jgi:hypothetical protein